MCHPIASSLISLVSLVGDASFPNKHEFDRIQSHVAFLPQEDADVIADYKAMENWRHARTSSVGFFKENGPKRVSTWKAAAEHGSHKGMVLYARCLQEGSGVEKNAVEALRWLCKAVELGNTDAMYNLGFCYLEGIGLEKDPVTAVKWFRKLTGLGCADAMVTLGACYAGGLGVENDAIKAVDWFRKAAELGDTG